MTFPSTFGGQHSHDVIDFEIVIIVQVFPHLFEFWTENASNLPKNQFVLIPNPGVSPVIFEQWTPFRPLFSTKMTFSH